MTDTRSTPPARRRGPTVRRAGRATPSLLLLLAAACGGGTTDPPPPPTAACTFANPVATGADPWVVRHEGVYYSVASANGGIVVYRSPRLTDPHQNPVRVWTPPETGWNRTNVWAPELHFLDGRWYVYYTAGSSGPPFTEQRSGVLESVGTDPQGAYVDRGRLDTGGSLATRDDDVWAIDLTVGRVGGQLYAVWSGWEENRATDRTPQHLYIARMANPTTMATTRVRLSSPTEAWERGTELDLQEGPTFLQNGAHVFVVYSTRESWLQFYRLGQLRLTNPAEPLQAGSWTKSGPVFEGAPAVGVYGAGHASFTVSPDGAEPWIVYHAKTSAAPGWNDRVVRTQRFGWNADGSPNFGTPVAAGERVQRPAGECQ